MKVLMSVMFASVLFGGFSSYANYGSEVTSSEEFNDESESATIEESLEGLFSGEDSGSEEVTIEPIFEFAGPGSKANCSCKGEASWYGPGFHGKKTASGAKYNQNGITAAHRCLPFGTKVKVCLVKKPKKCVTVTINDRGPYHGARIIDLSKGAALKIGMGPDAAGTAQVTLSKCR